MKWENRVAMTVASVGSCHSFVLCNPGAKQLELLLVMTFLPYQFAGDVHGFVQKSSKAFIFPFMALNLGMANNS